MIVVHYTGDGDNFGGLDQCSVEVGHNTHVGTTPDEVFVLVNQIYTLFDEGYITHEQCCVALGLTNHLCVNDGADICEEPDCPYHGDTDE